jgi:putative FmdB family regulatory protein
MPTYTYECKKCGSAQDEFHGMNATPVVLCGSCGSKRMRKLQGMGAGIIFKGSGFYETDYKRKGSNGKDSNGKSEGKSGSKQEGASKSGSTSDSGSSKDSGSSRDTKKAAAAS